MSPSATAPCTSRRSTASTARATAARRGSRRACRGYRVEEVITHPGTSAVYARTADWINPGFPGKFGYGVGVVVVSRDRGASWEYIDEEFQNYGFVSAVALDPGEPSTVYVAVGLVDGTLAFERRRNNMDARGFDLPGGPRLAVDHARGLVYAATDGSIVKSADGGATWSEVVSPLPNATLCGRDVCPGAVAVGGTGNLYAGRAGVLCRSADAAATWTCADVPGYPEKSSSYLLPLRGHRRASSLRPTAASSRATMEASPGRRWKAHPVRHHPDPGAGVRSGGNAGDRRHRLRRLPQRRRRPHLDGRERRAAGSVASRSRARSDRSREAMDGRRRFQRLDGTRPFQSADGGASWSPASGADGPRRVDALAIDPRDPSTLYAGGEAVYRTDDGGAHWTRSAPPRDSPVRALAVDPFDSSHVLAGTGGGDFQGFMDDATGGRLFVSEDAGRTWTARGPDREIYSLLFDHRRPGKIYASSSWDLSDSWYYPDINGGSIWVSDDNGVSWLSRTVTPLEAYPSSPSRSTLMKTAWSTPRWSRTRSTAARTTA